MNIALIGFGTVGQGLVEVLREKATDLQQSHHFSPRVVAVTTGSRGSLYHPDGLDLNALLHAAQRTKPGYAYLDEAYPDSAGLQRGWSAQRIAVDSNADVLIEASPSNLETGQPALDLCYLALDSGKHLILANKGPVALAYTDLVARANANQRHVLLEATVMAGTPAIRTGLEALAGCNIRAVRGILNGTTNYMLTQMEQGLTYGEALQQAQELGYAEADPTGDVAGWDAAGKVLILTAAFFGLSLTMRDLTVTGITTITQGDIQAAQANGQRWKLIAEATPQGGSVKPMRLPIANPLANVSGATNAITYQTDLLGDVTLVGAGAGRKETGFALLADLLALRRNL